MENHLLRAVPEDEYRLLAPWLDPVSLSMQEVLLQPGSPIAYVYFLTSGLTSLLVLTNDAKSVEVCVVGKEGFLGSPIIAGMNESFHRAVIQVPGEALRIKSEKLQELLPRTPGLQALLNRYMLLWGTQVAQIAACNRLHEIEQRLARWLLLTHDRVQSDTFPITHDMLAQMLGSGRPSVTVAAGALQRAGIIEYTRGRVRILDRAALERSACECYQIMRALSGTGTSGRSQVSVA